MPKVAITGATGLVGKALGKRLKDYEVLRVSRDRAAADVYWNPAKGEIEAEKLEGVDSIIHLAGYGIAEKRWTPEVKQQIRQSRIDGTRLIVETLKKLHSQPSTFLSASAIGYYGDRGDEELDESASPGNSFLANICKDWEAEALRAEGIRVVCMRIGIVLSRSGGALKKMLLPFQLGMGGRIGSGTQYMSWISMDDLVSGIVFCLENPEVSGAVNFTAPHPVTNLEFTQKLAKALGRPSVIPLPAFAARLLAGEMADELLLSSIRALPQMLESSGFEFEHPELDSALKRVLLLT